MGIVQDLYTTNFYCTQMMWNLSMFQQIGSEVHANDMGQNDINTFFFFMFNFNGFQETTLF